MDAVNTLTTANSRFDVSALVRSLSHESRRHSKPRATDKMARRDWSRMTADALALDELFAEVEAGQ